MQTLSGEAHLRDLCPPSTTAIIITPPSSPDESTKAPQTIHKTPPPQPYQSWPLSDRSFSAPFDSPHLSPTPTARSEPPRMSPFQERLAALDLPPPGADHFAARRTLWLSPGPNPPCATEANPSRQRLEALLAPPGAVEDDDVWKTGVDRVWRGLVAGARLKHRLPLALVIKILQAGWIRENTWPRGALPPESDEPLDAPTQDASGPPYSPMAIAGTPDTTNVHPQRTQENSSDTMHTDGVKRTEQG